MLPPPTSVQARERRWSENRHGHDDDATKKRRTRTSATGREPKHAPTELPPAHHHHRHRRDDHDDGARDSVTNRAARIEIASRRQRDRVPKNG